MWSFWLNNLSVSVLLCFWMGCPANVAVAAKDTPTTDEAALTIQKGTSHDEEEEEPTEDEEA